MLFNKSYKKKNEDVTNIEEDLKLKLNALKGDYHNIQKMRQRNTIGHYYNEKFKENEMSMKPKHSFKMISSSKINENNNEYLNRAFNTGSSSRHFVLNNRLPNYNRNEQFSLNIYNDNKSNEIIENDFTINSNNEESSDDDSEDDIDFDLLLNNKKKEEIKKKVEKKVDSDVYREKNEYIEEPIIKNTSFKTIDTEETNTVFGNNLSEYLRNGNEIKNELYVSNNKIKNENIQTVCYTTWHTKNLPPLMEKNFEYMQENNPEITFYLYDEKESRDFIKNNFDNDVLDAYDRLSPSSYKSDLWRYCILYKRGGIYLDIKYKTINDFKLIDLCNKEYFVYDHANNSDNKSFWNKNEFGLYTALIVCEPNNKIIRQCIHKITENTENFYYGKNALYPTGPGLLGQCFFSNSFHLNKIKEIELFHHTKSNSIIYKNTQILDIYDDYRKEQTEYQNNLHYSALWNQRCIYNMKFSLVNVSKKNRNFNQFLPKILCICHIGSYQVFVKMKQYIDNLISAHYDDYNLSIYFNVIETISKQHMNEIKNTYPDENFVLSENYGFDIGSFFHVLEIVKQRKEKYDYVVKIHTKTNNEKREELLQPILGNVQTIRKIISQMKEDNNIGIIASRKGRCIDTHTDFIRNQTYLQKLVTWFFKEQTRITKQVYVTGTMFWIRFDILEKTFMKINIPNIINSFNNIHTFDWNWYYYANNKIFNEHKFTRKCIIQSFFREGKDIELIWQHFSCNKKWNSKFSFT